MSNVITVARGTAPTVNAAAPPTQPKPSAIQASDFERAFADIEPEIHAVPTEQLTHITVDVRTVAINTIARLARIQELRSEIATHMPLFDLSSVDRLGTYALAATHAYIRHQMAGATPAEVAQLASRVTERRAILLADVNALVAHGLIDGAPLAGLAGTVGYRNVAYDLLLLRNMLAEAWPRIADKTVLQPADLEEDAAIATRLLMAAGAKSVLPVEPAETARVRDQAFALFAKKYDQVRRAVWFVRWDQGDADEYAPSFYAGRTARKSDETPSPEAPPAENVTPTTAAPAAASAPTPDVGPGQSPFIA